MPPRRDTRRHIGPWLVAEVATRFDVAPASAKAIASFVLECVVQDARNLAEALVRVDPDLGIAVRTVIARLDYGAGRLGGSAGASTGLASVSMTPPSKPATPSKRAARS